MISLLTPPEKIELELKELALIYMLENRKHELVKEHDALELRIENASSDNPVDIMDERELQELKYMLDYIEKLEAMEPPF